ncbi:acidic mammalian chitinase [Cryptotermes secundus]|nr:acidic mammalian chitinase [Cryptotermes secundus]
MKSWLIILGAAITVLNYAAHSAAEKKVVCYHGSWSVYRPGDGKFEIEYIDPNLCTHVIYAFVGLQYNDDVRIMDSWNEIDKGGFQRFNDLRKRNPSLKTLVAIGGWNEGSASYSSVVNDASRRAAFVNNIVKFVGEYGFDGFDLDWEYPAQRGGAATDKNAFSLLLRELRTEFDKHGYLLSAAVASAAASASLSYDISELGKYLDFINVMTYDLHGPWDPVTGHNAPLYAGSNDDGLTVDAAIQYWINQGAPREKIILGIGTYGRTFTLTSSSQCIMGAPANGAGNSGPYTREGGTLGYNEICEEQSTWMEVWDDQQKVPYACKGNQWVGYDNVKSTLYKVRNTQINQFIYELKLQRRRFQELNCYSIQINLFKTFI